MDRIEQLKQFTKIVFPQRVEKNDLAVAYQMGMLKRDELRDGNYYIGFSRNTYVAMWSNNEGAFIYMRNKIVDIFPEKIYYPERGNMEDFFIPLKLVIPLSSEIIKPEKRNSFILHKRSDLPDHLEK